MLDRVRVAVSHLVEKKFTQIEKQKCYFTKKKIKTLNGNAHTVETKDLRLKIGAYNLHGINTSSEFAQDLAIDTNVLFYSESMCEKQLIMQSHFTIPGKKLFNRAAKKTNKRGRGSSGIGFIVDENLRCQINTKINDRIATAKVGNLMIIGVHLIHCDGSLENELSYKC